MQSITAGQLKALLSPTAQFFLVDVREAWEHEDFNIGGLHIPLQTVMARRAEIPADVPVIIYCEKGIRSVIAIQRLEQAGFKNLCNLAGGMVAWRQISTLL